MTSPSLQKATCKLAVLDSKLAKGSEDLLERFLEALQGAGLLPSSSESGESSYTAIHDLYRAVDPQSLPVEMKITPYTLVELLLPEVETSTSRSYRQIR